METRSSPSLGLLQELAKHARVSEDDLPSLSKTALFGHLQSKFDYGRLERAHTLALKRGGGGGSLVAPSLLQPPASKRRCSKRRGGKGSGSSSSAKLVSREQAEGEELPAASIFLQTRSRSRSHAALSSSREVDSGPGSNSGAGLETEPGIRLSTSANSSIESPVNGEVFAEGGVSCSISASPRVQQSQRQGRCTRSRQVTRSRKASPIPSQEEGHAAGKSPSDSGGSDRGCGAGITEGTCDDNSKGKAKLRDEPATVEEVQGGGGSGMGKAVFGPHGAGEGDGHIEVQGQNQGQEEVKGKGKGKVQMHCNGKGNGNDGECGNFSDNLPGVCEASPSKVNVEDGQPTNDIDPIMLTKLGKHQYMFVRPNGMRVMYNLDSLVDYFLSTGDFTEPLTRLPFTDKALSDIDTKVAAAGLCKPSVLEAKQQPERFSAQKFQQEALVGLERMTSELVTGMLRVVEEFDREEGEIHLVAELFPPFKDLFNQIRTADSEFARQCMQHYISWLEGPPNNPTEDEVGFLHIILCFMRILQEGGSSLGF